MQLVSMKEMLEKALAEGYAVGHYNLNNLEFTQAILQAADEERSPLICGVSEGAARYMGGFRVAVDIVKGLIDTYGITVPVAIHLDHGSSFEKCVQAIRAGFTSVMFDGSSLPLEENIAQTRRVVDVAHALGVSVEAELGRIGGEEDDIIVKDAEKAYAIPEECLELVEKTGVDFLAPALGSVHGPYKGEPNLDFARMGKIRDMTGCPLVLHGGTGIPTADIKKAIKSGTCKINVNTENQFSFTRRVKEIFEEKPDLYDPRKYLGPAREAIKETVIEKIREFGSAEKI